MIYFDNAATSFPKPQETIRAMERFMTESGGSPGRSGHRLSIAAAETVFDARDKIAGLLGAADPLEVAFTKNATEALNIAIFGLLKPGSHAITSAMEHNSVMRPLRALQKKGVELSIVPCSPRGEMDPGDLLPLIRRNTEVIFMTHASNVTGAILSIGDIGRIARERDILFCVDSAQTAGALPIDVGEMQIDLLAFTGHKSLFGPQGTGGLYVRKGLESRIAMLMRGGTGSRSESEVQPEFMPDRFESGTPNGVGLAGLGAGAEFVSSEGLQNIRAHETRLTGLFLKGIGESKRIKTYGPADPDRQLPIVSFTIAGLDPGMAALKLDEDFNVLARSGLHCAPSAHRTIGTFPAGTVRFSFGHFNTEEQILRGIDAVLQLTAQP